jgi:hypothetical protein
MAEQNQVEKYSEQLFNSLFDKIKSELGSIYISTPIQFNGLWAFSYWEGTNSLQSVYFNHVSLSDLQNNYLDIIEEAKNTRLDCDYGSLGFSFTKLKDETTIHVDFLTETYNDAKGTVCYYDTIIGQQHACFVIVRNNREIFGALDFIFEGELNDDYSERIKDFFETMFYKKETTVLTDFINAFKIRQFEDFLTLQVENTEIYPENPGSNDELNNATKYIERLIAVSSKTPLMVVKYKNGKSLPELVSLNFDFIHSIIMHEHRFCPLTTEKLCFHFKDFDSFKNHALKCDNQFLKNYYYDVLKSLDANLVTNRISVGDAEYIIEIVCMTGYTCKEIANDSITSLSKEIEDKTKKLKNEIAIHKYRDERVYLFLNNLFKNNENIYTFSLSRNVKPHLKLSVKCDAGDGTTDCAKRNQCITEKSSKKLKQFISPSTILPVQFENEQEDILKQIENENKSIVHFKIVNSRDFICALKKLIANNTILYSSVLEPYVNAIAIQSSINFYNNLSISFVGESPLFDNRFAEVIKGKLNLIEYLLQEEEIKVQARKAAISQVMLRNMSHNIGSHVLANLTLPESILEMVFTNTHDNLTNGEKMLADAKKLTYNNSEGKEINVNSKPTSFNVAIAELSSYMRTRMDFLADISTGTAVIETSKKLAKDVIEPFENKAILLKKYITGNNKSVSIKNPNDQIIAAFPNDNLGVQALYVIIENVIRNSAKHSKSGKAVEIQWKCDDNTNPDLTELIIFDKNDQKEAFELTELINEQNNRIAKDMLENGVLRQGSWGMLEMKIAAAYLRKLPVESIDEIFSPPLFTAVPVPEKNGKCLGYKFYLLKPRHVLIVVNDSDGVALTNEHDKHGIKLISISDLSRSKETFGHDIVLLADCNEQCIYTIRKRLSARIINTNVSTLEEKLNSQSADFIDWAWEEWFNKLIEKTNPVTAYKIDDSGNTRSTMELKSYTAVNDIKCRKAVFVYHCNAFRENEDYFEPYGSLHPAREQIDALFNHPGYKLQGHFLETINYTVAIADERIQKHNNANFDGGIVGCTKKHIDFLEKCGIILPPFEIDLNTKSFDTIIGTEKNEKTIKQSLKEWCEEQATKCNFLVIHIGIIERLLELDNVKDEQKQQKIHEYLAFLRNIQNRKARFIITSGRGQPESLPKGERFIHYSNIAQYIIEKRSKFHLMQLLMSARETN